MYFINETYTHIRFKEESLINPMKKIGGVQIDIGEVVHIIEEEKSSGEIEFLRAIRDDPTGILKGLSFSFKVSTKCSSIYGDLLFWDSNRNLTVSETKISYFSISDSKNISRHVIFNLTLVESLEDRERFL